jgi:hypothetical protein
MGNEIQKNLAQRAKELLQTDVAHSLFELPRRCSAISPAPAVRA